MTPLRKSALNGTSIRKVLYDLVEEFPVELRGAQRLDVPRIAFHIALILKNCGQKASVCDVGGGVGLFSLGCAALGLSVRLIDDFEDRINQQYGDSILEPHRRLGVEVLRRNALEGDLPLARESLDAICLFETLEHWHHSPKRFLHRGLEALRGGGLLVIAVPNCVSLRKRIAVPLGYSNWSFLHDWYEEEVFRGHVREMTASDLRYLANDLELGQFAILGRNWGMRGNGRRWVRFMGRALDYPLRLAPTLCSDLYLIGSKEASLRGSCAV